jgi:TRAP-type mannitol/chloroaromatic compound transport system permease small subunit
MSQADAATASGSLARAFGWLGHALSVCMLAMVLLCFALVVARYAFDSSPIAGQELVQWMHAVCFMLGAALALRHGAHVRVDVLHARWSLRTRAWVELIGTLLCLLPFAGFMLWTSLDYVNASLQMRESSQESGGLGAVYLLKALIPLAAGLLILQGLVDLRAAWRKVRR